MRMPSPLGDRETAPAIRRHSGHWPPALRTTHADGAGHDSSSPQTWAWPSRDGTLPLDIVPGGGDLGEKKLAAAAEKEGLFTERSRDDWTTVPAQPWPPG